MEISLKPQSFDLRRDIRSQRNRDVVEVGSTVTSLSLVSVGNLGESKKKAEDKICCSLVERDAALHHFLLSAHTM